MQIRNTATRELIRTLAGSPTLLHALDVHPNGSRLANLGRDSLVRVWDIESGQEVLALPATTAPAANGKLVWSPDGECLYSSHNVVRVWNARSEEKSSPAARSLR